MSSQIDLLLVELTDKPVAYHPAFRRIGGSAAAGIFLSQAFYWSKRTTLDDNWFYKTAIEWEDETGLSRSEQETARKSLIKKGILEEEKRGIPAKLHFRINRKKVIELLIKEPLQTSLPESSKLDCGDVANKDAGIQQTNTESTTEITTESTTIDNPFPVNGEVIAASVEHAKWLSKAGQAREVFEDWKEVMESPRSKMDSKREKLIIAKLDLGYSVEDLKLATRGCVLTPWNMGTDPNNKAKTIYNDPELIFRDASHVDRFRAIALKKGKSANDKLRKSDYDGSKSSANRTGFVAGKRI